MTEGITKRAKANHIDDVQPATIHAHFEALSINEDPIDYDPSEDLTPADFPEWYDERLFKVGQDYVRSNLLGISMATVAGLITLMTIPTITQFLLYTKQSGNTCTAFKRYLQTILHARVWYTRDATTKGSDWFRSLNVVRLKHSNSSLRSLKDGYGGITKRDMAYTQFGFIGFVLLQPKYLGLTNNPEEREGINHFWRVLGHMLGVPDRLNICRKTEAETTELCNRLQVEVFSKYLKEMPPYFNEITDTLLNALWVIEPSINKDGFLAFTFNLNGLAYNKPLSTYSWLNLKYRELVHKLLGAPIIGPITRLCFNYLVYFYLWIIEKWPVVAWIQFGKKNSKINMYPKLK